MILQAVAEQHLSSLNEKLCNSIIYFFIICLSQEYFVLIGWREVILNFLPNFLILLLFLD